MLPERLSASLRYFTGLALQPANRWDGFDLSAPESREASLRGQILFSGCALAALAAHPSAGADEAALAGDALAALVDRMIQRRVWAVWAAETERASRKPDPVDAGYGAYSGALSVLLGLQAAVGGQVRYLDDPFVLRWSADVRASYTADELAESLWRQARASPEGAISCEADTATASGMAAALWALRLHDAAYGSAYGAAGDAWLSTLGGRMAIRGPRLPGRGALAGSLSLRSRRASLGGDALEDAWALALTASLDRDLVARLAERHWPALPKIRERGEHLAAAFSYLLAVELGDAERAAGLLAYAEERLGPEDDAEVGRRYAGAPAAPWVTALFAIGEAGGLGRLLAATPPAAPAPPADSMGGDLAHAA
ncbi:hypothetical protein K2Z83_22620 [Oscillochloris sp. ZM17-4]|uniref:linalool dehydratase/isomerase domain-containing protein n=1 Tax=Oscillochloris sp. ZM17-4 TaxID=2866714 RepID=UPI001C738F14|nr:hypothetical protein [Oscillochloris sp. ZM17-4]MBX0330456.1 hypothetical protein [Oscillochloris sp. ZM17-4]